MSDQFTNDPLLDMFLFETSQLLEQLEQIIITSEKESSFSTDSVNEIFRIMHTIKGSAAMMLFDNISKLAHTIEDLFYYLRNEKQTYINCSNISDFVLNAIDFIKVEVEKIKAGSLLDGNPKELVTAILEYLDELKQASTKSYPYSYKATIRYEEGCEMENIRAFAIVNNLRKLTQDFSYQPEDIIDNDDSIYKIRQDGFQIYLKTDLCYEKMEAYFKNIIFLRDLELILLEENPLLEAKKGKESEPVAQDTIIMPTIMKSEIKPEERTEHSGAMERENQTNATQQIISVSVHKLDRLMDLVGEVVIAQAMVLQNPDLNGLELNNFKKAARQLSKITDEIQDMVMSIRMVPLATTFNKMHRIVRDMSKKLDKEVNLRILGEETEVDKNIIEHISDPLMHLVRNAIDHGIEPLENRVEKGKPKVGTITLEAKNSGSDVLIIVKDDGKGLSKEKILIKARERNLLYKSEEEMSDREIFNLILLPGFSTKEKVTEYSGRGVGLDVVGRNIETIGGSISIDSTEGKGTTITLKIPLTLAIIDGMNIKVGNSCYTIPIISIKDSFRPLVSDIITDPDGNEMIMVRGQCYQICRLHELFSIKTEVMEFTDGIIIMIEQDEKQIGIFADELLGQQQVVVKAMPDYIQNFKRTRGIAGCTLLGDGNISLILDISRLLNN